ncbi:uncharacterized protein LOC123317076 [Coccinella septempunctata]|uniref:uncharacterized protein LOC123317076 n=1 Tax=Coccinella septempunctata TaxID=41139 RepID=UPI001D070792|nr:uncharacterized protein LOC123317076 [Coccinella septempunctata]
MGTRIPLSLLRDLKCRHCKNFLSCGPVYVTPDCGLLCGRCKALAKPNFRNYVYEELANTFVFPCLNWEKHCPEEGPWNTLKHHEIDCPYGSSCSKLCVDPAAFFSSKKNLPNEENLLYLEVPEKCLNLVSCKNCGKYLSSQPVHINVVGSNICHRCYLSNGLPPHTLRNLAYEKLANIFRFPCIFRAKGCPIKFRFGRDSWEHEVNCHYRDVQVHSTPGTPELDPNTLHIHIDNSGYRPSVEGDFYMDSRNNSREVPRIELPRVSSILRNQDYARETRLNQQRKKEQRQMVTKQSREYKDNLLHPPGLEYHQFGYESGRKETINDFNKNRIPDKERGIVPTHTGHVYATLTKDPVLFAPPQRQPYPSNGQQVTKEFQDKIMRSDSNVSQKNSPVQERIRNSIVSSSLGQETEKKKQGMHSYNTLGIPPPPGAARQNSDGFSGLNKSYMKDLEGFNEDYAPVIKEYVQFNPQNNVQRNESLTIGNPDIIAELKMRNQQKRRIRQDEEDSDSLGIV